MNYKEIIKTHSRFLVGDGEEFRAHLSGAHLRGADLSGAHLRGAVGILYTGFDARGWVLVLWKKNEHYWFNAGCRSLEEGDALTHWGGKDYPDLGRGKMYVGAIEFLIKLWEMKL